MSKNRVIVLSVTHQNLTVVEVAKRFQVSERRIYQLLAQVRKHGLESLEASSRRPKSNPKQTSSEVVEAIKSLRLSLAEQGLDNGAHTISWHLVQQGINPPAISTIWLVPKNSGPVENRNHG